MLVLFKHLIKSKELFIALYFCLFIFGISFGIESGFYNEYRIFEIFLLFLLIGFGLKQKKYKTHLFEWLFFVFLFAGSIFWKNPEFTVIELLVYYLLFKAFQIIDFNIQITKIIVLMSLLIWLMFPFALYEYFQTGVYNNNWYPLPWNMRVYDSYFVIISIFATWLYIKDEKFKRLYLLLIFLSLFTILMDGGRSALLALTCFSLLVCIFNNKIRLPLLCTYAFAWMCFIFLTKLVSNSSNTYELARASSSGRFKLWTDALSCWKEVPILGCGFYQSSQVSAVAHPHNIFIQVLSETGIIGLLTLIFIIVIVIKRLGFNVKQSYFVWATLIAVFIEISLSGNYIYPITQVGLLWLFIFLLKNSDFNHDQIFVYQSAQTSKNQLLISYSIFIILVGIFLNLFITTTALNTNLPVAPPRFWEYGFILY